MQNTSDAELLRDYAGHGSEAAFGEIVRRYADFVYSAALRQVGNPEQARDVAQSVFVDLARKAGSLHENTLLVGWLCQSARLAALEQLRRDQRRLQRETHAMDLLDRSSGHPSDWSAVRPVLDEAIASLSDEDRNALLLRFFKNESLASVGTFLGVSEDAAQKRVSRSLDKLRDFLERRGIKTTAAALSVALAANAVNSAPAGLAATLTTGALAQATAGGSALTLVNLFTASNVKIAALILVVAGALAGVTVSTASKNAADRRWRESARLAAEQADEIMALRRANEQLQGQVVEIDRLRSDAQDVLRLRAEVSQLKHELTMNFTNSLRRIASRAPSTTNTAPPSIHIGTRVVYVPGGIPGMPAVQSGTTTLLTKEQVDHMYAVLEGDHTVWFNSSGISTESGLRANVFLGQHVPVLKPDASVTMTNIGLTIDVLPTCSAGSSTIQLTLSGKLNRRLDTSPELNGAGPKIEMVEVSAELSMSDGQTAMLAKELIGEGWLQSITTNAVSGDGMLLMFVTPKIEKTGNFQSRLVPIKAVVRPPD